MFWRYRHYRRWRKLWSRLTLVATESEVIVGELVTLMTELPLEKLAQPPKAARNWLNVLVYCENLALLVQRLEQVNHWIEHQQDQALEQLAREVQQDRQSILLDFYLTDAHLHRLPVQRLLFGLRDALQAHQRLLSAEPSFYYQRLSESVYQDCLIVLEVLITAHGPLLEEDIMT